jgi:3-phosphoshikimate 1-carboxyvinyltransferase
MLKASGLKGGDVELDLGESTQFASGLLLAAPYAAADMRLRAMGDRLQTPYVEMTAAVMGHFGAAVERLGRSQGATGEWTVRAGQRYQAVAEYPVEPDLSAAAYFFAAPAFAPGRVKVRGVGNASIQGDIAFLKVLQHLGVRFYQEDDGLMAELHPHEPLKGGVTVDMNAFSDQALTLAALAPFADGPVKIVNVAHIRRQECDRIRAIAENLGALGVAVREFEDGVEIQPWPAAARRGAVLKTFGDHRVAMAFSLIGLAVPGVVIDDPDCVAKTFPDFWAVLDSLRKGGAHGS